MAISRSRVSERQTTAAPRSDAYTGMLAISLGALVLGSFLLYLDYSQYPPRKPDAPPSPSAVRPAGAPIAPAESGTSPTPTPAPGIPPQPGTPPGQ